MSLVRGSISYQTGAAFNPMMVGLPWHIQANAGLAAGAIAAILGDLAAQGIELVAGWRDYYDPDQTINAMRLAGVFGACYGVGPELKWGPGKKRTFRIDPFGNRTGNPNGEMPHYHLRKLTPKGKPIKGQGMTGHRTWDEIPRWDQRGWRDRW